MQEGIESWKIGQKTPPKTLENKIALVNFCHGPNKKNVIGGLIIKFNRIEQTSIILKTVQSYKCSKYGHGNTIISMGEWFMN